MTSHPKTTLESLSDPVLPTPAQAVPGKRRPKRRRVFAALGLLAILSALGWIGQEWWNVWRFIESTDDAFVQADIVTLSTQVAGQVVAVPVRANSVVARGAVLARVDDRPYRAALRSAQAQVALAEAGLAAAQQHQALQGETIAAAKAELAGATAQWRLAEANYQRAMALLKNATGTPAMADKALAQRDGAAAAQARAAANVQIQSGQMPLLKAAIRQNLAQLDRAKATLTLAELDLQHTTIRAPVAGIVGNLGVTVGEYVRPGLRLMSVVPVAKAYVTANFKETQIAHLRQGMAADVEVDMLGGEHLAGRIVSLSPASGAEFSVLPPDNATGNFTKIVQRIPVRIALSDPADAARLRPGGSVRVSVNVKAAAK